MLDILSTYVNAWKVTKVKFTIIILTETITNLMAQI